MLEKREEKEKKGEQKKKRKGERRKREKKRERNKKRGENLCHHLGYSSHLSAEPNNTYWAGGFFWLLWDVHLCFICFAFSSSLNNLHRQDSANDGGLSNVLVCTKRKQK